MNSISKSKKALNFDLYNQLLKIHYPSKNYKKGWSDIKEYLESQGFIHRQYSGYVSKDVMQIGEAIQIVLMMSYSFSWLRKCVKEFDVTIVGDEYSFIDYIYQSNDFK